MKDIAGFSAKRRKGVVQAKGNSQDSESEERRKKKPKQMKSMPRKSAKQLARTTQDIDSIRNLEVVVPHPGIALMTGLGRVSHIIDH